MDTTPRRIGLLVFAVEVAFILVMLAVLPASVRARSEGDFVTYYRPVADRILDGHGLAHGAPDGGPAIRYPPGQPLAIAGALRVARAVGASDTAGLDLATALLMGLATVFIYDTARRTFGMTAALIGVAAWMVFPSTLFLATRFNSEVTFMALAAAAIWIVLRVTWMPRWPDDPVTRVSPVGVAAGAAGAGAVAGLALLVRPVGVAVVVPLVVVLLLRRAWAWRQRLVASGLFVVAILLVTAPWIAWASAEHHSFVPLSTGAAPSVRDGLTFGVTKEPGRTWVPGPARGAMNQAERLSTGGDPRSGLALVRTVAVRRPLGFTELIGLKALRAWYGTESLRDEWLVGLGQLPFLALIGWGAWPLFRLWGDATRRTAALLLAMVGLTWLMTIAVLSVTVYMAPVLGLAMTMAGVGPADLPIFHRRIRKAMVASHEAFRQQQPTPVLPPSCPSCGGGLEPGHAAGGVYGADGAIVEGWFSIGCAECGRCFRQAFDEPDGGWIESPSQPTFAPPARRGARLRRWIQPEPPPPEATH